MRIRSLRLLEVKEVGDYFASHYTFLVNLEVPKLEKAGVGFAYNCLSLGSLHLPKLEEASGWFAGHCTSLVKLEVPNLRTAGDYFAYNCRLLPIHTGPES